MKKPPDKNLPSVAELAQSLGCEFKGNGQIKISGVSSLELAEPGDLVFFAKEKFRPLLEKTRASAAIVPHRETFDRIPVIFSDNPQLSFVRAMSRFYAPKPEPTGIHPLAVIAPTAKIEANVSIGPLTVVGDYVEIGAGTILDPLVSVYPHVSIGRNCRIHSHVSLRNAVRVGNEVTIHNGVVIGADGFGYVQAEDGSRIKIPQTGIVIIEDKVEIGANTTIDRAAFGATVIAKGTKIDNLVQIAHNVEIGENSILIAQAGIAGSSKVGKNVIISGQAGITDHVKIGDEAVVSAQTGVSKDVPGKAIIGGTPHQDIKEWYKASASLLHLHDLIKEVRRLKKRLAEWEKKGLS